MMTIPPSMRFAGSYRVDSYMHDDPGPQAHKEAERTLEAHRQEIEALPKTVAITYSHGFVEPDSDSADIRRTDMIDYKFNDKYGSPYTGNTIKRKINFFGKAKESMEEFVTRALEDIRKTADKLGAQ